MKVVGIIIACFVGLIILGWALGWLVTPFGVSSAANAQQQFGFAYQSYESLKASAQNVCVAEKAVTDAESSEERIQRQSQLQVLETNYNRIAAAYNAKMADAFQAKYVRPNDLPAEAPTMGQMRLKVCN